jgi:hypothetical protein
LIALLKRLPLTTIRIFQAYARGWLSQSPK